MANLYEFQKLLNSINDQKYLELALFEQIKIFEGVFINSQKEQLSEGVNFKGKTFGKYSEATENWERDYIPRQPKIAGEPYNFEDTGGLFDGMVLNVYEDHAEFWSEDEKTPFLVTDYKDLFGLGPERLSQIISSVILPAFLLEIRRALKIG